MEQLNLTVPYVFIEPRVQLNWREARFGFDQGLFAPHDTIRLATDQLAAGVATDHVVELSCIGVENSVQRVLYELADNEQATNEETLQRVWAFLALSWVASHRDKFDDPLDVAESIYADLGYPQQVRFIRYLPSQLDVMGDHALYEQWDKYLRAEGSFFATRTSADTPPVSE